MYRMLLFFLCTHRHTYSGGYLMVVVCLHTVHRQSRHRHWKESRVWDKETSRWINGKLITQCQTGHCSIPRCSAQKDTTQPFYVVWYIKPVLLQQIFSGVWCVRASLTLSSINLLYDHWSPAQIGTVWVLIDICCLCEFVYLFLLWKD